MTNRTKSILFCVVMGIFFVVAIMGWHWTDTAKKEFWWTFWIVAAIVSFIGFVGGIYWYSNNRKKW